MAGLDNTNDRVATTPQDDSATRALLADGTQPWRQQVADQQQATQPETYQRTEQPWRAGYNQVAPAYGDGQQQQQQQAQPQTQPWRAGFNQVAPAYNDGTQQQQTQTQPGTQWRPGYNQVAPGAGGQDVQDPNRNGDQQQGPRWNPNPQVTWNSPGPAQNPEVNRPGQQQPGQNRQGQGGDNLYDPHRTDIDLGLQKQIGFGGQMIIGGLSGVAFGGPVPWILNRTADSILLTPEQRAAARSGAPFVSENGVGGRVLTEGMRDNLNATAERINGFRDRITPSQDGFLAKGAKWYQDNFDSRYFRRNDLVLQQNNFSRLDGQVGEMIKTTTSNLEALNRSMTPSSPASLATDIQRQQSRLDWLQSPKWKEGGAQQLTDLKTSMNLNERGLFTEAEMKVLAERQAARTSVADITASQAKGQRFLGENPGSNFVKGAAFVGLTMVADSYLDRLFTGKDHKDNLTNSSMTDALPVVGGMTTSWNTNALLVPMAFTAGGWNVKGMLTKAAVTGGALIGGKVLDNLLPASESQQYSRWLRPTGVDSLLMGAAFLMPAAENKTRLAMIGGAWLAGRVYNMFEGPSKGDIKDEGFDKMRADMKDRTSGSMNAAINSFKELGEKDNYALRLYTSDWLRPNRQYDGMLSAYRGAVILADAFGESRLDKGTLLPNAQKDFVLAGKDLDLGGQATRALIIAQVNVDRAKQQTQNEMGKDEKGKKVSEQELKDLDEVGKRINSVLQNRIYGKHDIPGAVNDLAEFYRGNEKDTLLMKMDIDNSLALNRGSQNTQFTAKLFRDQAVLLLAIAQLKAGGPDAMGATDVLYGTAAGRQTPYNNGQPRGYDGALDAIALAKQMDPNNPDIAQLEAIANQLKQKLPQQVQDQRSSTTFNPLNVDDQVNNPGSRNPIADFGKR